MRAGWGWAALAALALAGCGTAAGEELQGGSRAACAVQTCESLEVNCGVVSDGCGGTLQCGTCESGTSCGGGGVPNVCGSSLCYRKTCADLVATCGAAEDGCGGTLDCGECPAGQACGANGVPNACGAISCDGAPPTCALSECGLKVDACGASVSCGRCGEGEFCAPSRKCAAAEPLACAQTQLSSSLPLTSHAAPEDDRVAAECGLDGRERTFAWTAPFSGPFVVDTHGTNFDASLEVRRGSCEEPPYLCRNGAASSRPARFVIDAEGGDVFVFTVEGAQAADAEITLRVVEFLPVEVGMACGDGADNDDDDRLDCDDEDCAGEPNCAVVEP